MRVLTTSGFSTSQFSVIRTQLDPSEISLRPVDAAEISHCLDINVPYRESGVAYESGLLLEDALRHP